MTPKQSEILIEPQEYFNTFECNVNIISQNENLIAKNTNLLKITKKNLEKLSFKKKKASKRKQNDIW